MLTTAYKRAAYCLGLVAFKLALTACDPGNPPFAVTVDYDTLDSGEDAYCLVEYIPDGSSPSDARAEGTDQIRYSRLGPDTTAVFSAEGHYVNLLYCDAKCPSGSQSLDGEDETMEVSIWPTNSDAVERLSDSCETSDGQVTSSLSLDLHY